MPLTAVFVLFFLIPLALVLMVSFWDFNVLVIIFLSSTNKFIRERFQNRMIGLRQNQVPWSIQSVLHDAR